MSISARLFFVNVFGTNYINSRKYICILFTDGLCNSYSTEDTTVSQLFFMPYPHRWRTAAGVVSSPPATIIASTTSVL